MDGQLAICGYPMSFNFFNTDLMSFLKEIEDSFQDAETFLQNYNAISYSESVYRQDIADAIQHIRIAKEYVANLRGFLPQQLEAQEKEYLENIIQTRKGRRGS
jgi:hypothetical protein